MLAAMAPVTIELDAHLLAAHRRPTVQQLSAHLCVRHPERFKSTALGPAKDTNPRVRRVLAEAAARAQSEHPKDVDELLNVLASDVRYSVRAAAQTTERHRRCKAVTIIGGEGGYWRACPPEHTDLPMSGCGF
ncbi:hypothetical protein GCM10010172_44180 [Paractinoplanes ferrugineus]|uniref:Uncharacterized protein n=1 Tax=Paractinoplanes ferrugineus TaxID=113564 RepID=A0A919MBE4_9ACTN|nr:hypothetical protein Afe05nite_54160 [Actinoplanes ferrugineus]